MDKISPQDYRKILDGIELNDILISNLKADIKHELISPGMSISINDKAGYQNNENGFIVNNKYTLAAKNKEKKNVLKIEANYILSYNAKSEINDDFFEVYKDISLPLNIWPFFRELVNSITSRMNIPPLTLPLLKR